MASERVQRRIESLLDEAETAVAQKDWATVRDRADAVLTLDPANGDAKFYFEAAGRGLTANPTGREAVVTSPTRSDGDEKPSRSPLPTSFAAGRYAVKKFLGEGGKKKVFLAHDTVLARDVAFALIKTEGLDDTSRQRVTREAQAMGKLGDHPNIVPIFDLGQEKDPATGIQQPFMVLPLMTGGDVEGVIEKAPDHRMPLERVLQIAKDTCEGLVFAHSKGIVHRDLKPGNVWLTERGAARIGDFGLAVATDRSRLTREGMMVGTVAYMPPEQAMGGEITPRADLYSLGAMLYEMVTGRPPFLGDDDIAIIGQHINTPPVAPGWHTPGCPKPLEALIMRLLAKDPAQRPESAKDVLAALDAVNVITARQTAPAAAGGKQEQGRSLDSMSSGVFVGRHKEMDQLRAALEESLSGHGRMVTLVGEPGIGKTRTAQELATYAGLRRCQVLWGRCYEGGGAPPYWPWVQAIRQFVHEREPDQLRKEMGSSASVIAEIVQEVKDRLPGLQPPSPIEDPESARFRLFDSIASFLKNTSRTQALVFVLDDLHWSDKPSLLLLEFVARELANSRILLIGTYRDVELNRRHPLAVTLGDLTKDRVFERVLLRGLQKLDVAKFIELAAAIKPPAGLVDAVFTQTEGNPLFVTEVVRLLVQEGHLAPERPEAVNSPGAESRERGKTTSWIVRVPQGVREVIGRRLDRLSKHCNEVLVVAAVIGRQFSLQGLLSVLNDPSAPSDDRVSEDRLLEVLEECLAARVIEEIPSAVGQYQFTHALIQETLTNELSITKRVRVVARIAQAFEQAYGTKADEHAAELASFFAGAETVLGPDKLIHYSLIAGKRAFEANAFEEALEHFSRANDSLGDQQDLRKAQALGGIGRSSAPPGFAKSIAEYQSAWNTVVRAFDLYLTLGRTNEAAELANSLFAFEGLRGTADLLERALKLVAPGSNLSGWLMARYGIALQDDRGDIPASRQRYEAAMEIARQTGDRKLEARVTVHMAQSAHAAAEFQKCVELGREAQRLGRDAGDPQSVSRPGVFMARSHVALGQQDEAVKVLELVLPFVHAVGGSGANVKLQIALVRSIAGDFGKARQMVSELTDATRFARTLGHFELHLGMYREPATQIGLLRERLIELEEDQHGIVFAGFAPISGFVAFVMEDLEMAGRVRKAVEHGLSLPERRLPRRLDPLNHGLGWAAAAQQDHEAARGAYEYLLSRNGLADSGCGLSVDHTLAVLSALLNDTAAASGHFNDAVGFLRKAGYRPELGWALANFGDFEARDGSPDGMKRSVRLWDEALAIAHELEMKPLVGRILARKKILKA